MHIGNVRKSYAETKKKEKREEWETYYSPKEGIAWSFRRQEYQETTDREAVTEAAMKTMIQKLKKNEQKISTNMKNP